MSGVIDRPKYSCALGGAIATLNALPRVVPILHAAPGCGLNLSYAVNGGSAYVGSGYCGGTALPSTNVCEREIVFGGEDRLKEQIEKTVEIVDADLYFVVTACMVEMIGDDVKGVTRDASVGDALVLAAETGGFKGNSYRGYDIVLQTLFREYVEKRDVKDNRVVNLWGIVPAHDVFWKGNLEILKVLLFKLGIKANTFFGENESLDDLKKCGNAALNIIVSDTYGLGAAKVFEEVHSTPYITVGMPIGAHGSDIFIDRVSEALGIDPDLSERVKREENERYFGYMARLSDLYNDYDLQRYTVVVSDSNYAPALTRYAADDLGWLPELVVITDIIDEEKKSDVLKRFDGFLSDVRPEIVFDKNEASILPLIKRHWPDDHNDRFYNSFSPAVILGSSFELDLANDMKAPILCVSYPVTNRVVLTKGYAGYDGGLSLTEDLLGTLISTR
jgi:nitrogenase molybdenum-iron protein beta chain